MNYPAILYCLMQGENLAPEVMGEMMTAILSGEINPIQASAFLVALHIKGETVDELVAAVRVLRGLIQSVPVLDNAHLVDTCGTGGDGHHTFNISTASALVASAAGAKVAKHGGRSASSKCGSADVLEVLGAHLMLSPQAVAEGIAKLNLGFMFAPHYHVAMRQVAEIRRSLGVRTVFNLLGPLLNPAGAKRQLLGVFSAQWLKPMANVLRELDSVHVWVVHGQDGLDEITVSGDTQVMELQAGSLRSFTLNPRQFGLPVHPLSAIQVESKAQAATMLQQVLAGENIPARTAVLLNAGATIHIAGLSPSMEQGIELAKCVLDNGKAEQQLQRWVAWTQAQHDIAAS